MKKVILFLLTVLMMCACLEIMNPKHNIEVLCFLSGTMCISAALILVILKYEETN